MNAELRIVITITPTLNKINDLGDLLIFLYRPESKCCRSLGERVELSRRDYGGNELSICEVPIKVIREALAVKILF